MSVYAAYGPAPTTEPQRQYVAARLQQAYGWTCAASAEVPAMAHQVAPALTIAAQLYEARQYPAALAQLASVVADQTRWALPVATRGSDAARLPRRARHQQAVLNLAGGAPAIARRAGQGCRQRLVPGAVAIGDAGVVTRRGSRSGQSRRSGGSEQREAIVAEQDSKPGGRPGGRSPGQRTRRPQGARDEPGRSEAAQAGAGGHNGPSRFGDVMACSRPEKYLIAAAPPAEASVVVAQLGQDPQITVARTIGQGQAAGGYPAVAVIETTPERAAALAQLPALYVEPDQRLGWGVPGEQEGIQVAGLTAGPVGELRRVVITVEDDGGHPLDEAAICLSGPGLPALGFTGADGRAELTVAAETAAGPDLLVVRPARDCWPARVIRPQLSAGEPISVRCERIVTTFPGFPDRPLSSWGSKVMGFDMLPPTHQGQGIRIAIIGSGAAAHHPDLAGRVAGGRDIVGQDDKTWREDPIGTGTHQAVLIAGKDDGTGVTGLAPEAELHICRTAPGGTCADLIEALDYCIEQKIDVALMTSGITADSALLAAKVSQARQHGIACIAAAGDGAREIARPAALPGVLAVGAVGQLGTFPPGSGLAAQLAGPPTPDGLFAPRFANHGPGLDCCAPGVAVVSGLPPASYGPLSGTGIAAAHVAAAAVLVLAHHPQFGSQVSRDAGRVDQLFYLILASCRPLPAIGRLRSGAGLPSVPAVVGMAPWGNHHLSRDGAARLAAPSPASGTPEDRLQAALAPLDAAMQSAGLIPG